MSFCSLLTARSAIQGSSFNCNFQRKSLLNIRQLSFTVSHYQEALSRSFSHQKALKHHLSALTTLALGLLGLRPGSSLVSRVMALGIASLATLSMARGLEPMGGPTFRINTDLAGNQRAPSAAAFSDGSFVVAWEGEGAGGESTDIYCRRYNTTGGPLDSTAFRITTGFANLHELPSVATFSDGGFVVTWHGPGIEGDSTYIYGRRFNAASEPLDSSAFSISMDLAGLQLFPSVAAFSDGSFVVTWHGKRIGDDGNDIYCRRYNAAGAPLDSSPFRVNTDLAGLQEFPNVATFSDGSFVVTWHGPGIGGDLADIYGRRYDATGARIDSTPFRINTDLTGIQADPSVAAFSNGGFVVTWYGKKVGGNDVDIYGRRYNTAGAPLDTPAFRINTDLAGIRALPVVVALYDGSFAVTWHGEGIGGVGNDIYCRRYNAACTPLDTSAFRINTDLAGDQINPSVAALSDGSFVVTWWGDGVGGNGNDVYGRIISGHLMRSVMTTTSDSPSVRIETTRAPSMTTIPATIQPVTPLGAGLAATIMIVACSLLSALGLYLVRRHYLNRRVHSVNQAKPQSTSSAPANTYDDAPPQRRRDTADQAYQQMELRENNTSAGSSANSPPYATPQTWLDKEKAGAAADQAYQQLELRKSNASPESSSYATPQDWLDKEKAGAAASSPPSSPRKHRRKSRSRPSSPKSSAPSSPRSQYNIPSDWRHA